MSKGRKKRKKSRKQRAIEMLNRELSEGTLIVGFDSGWRNVTFDGCTALVKTPYPEPEEKMTKGELRHRTLNHLLGEHAQLDTIHWQKPASKDMYYHAKVTVFFTDDVVDRALGGEEVGVIQPLLEPSPNFGEVKKLRETIDNLQRFAEEQARKIAIKDADIEALVQRNDELEAERGRGFRRRSRMEYEVIPVTGLHNVPGIEPRGVSVQGDYLEDWE